MHRKFQMMAGLKRSARMASALLLLALAIALDTSAQDVPMSVRLTSTLNVAGAPVGQSVTGEVLSPETFKGDAIKGKITLATVAHGKATVEFQFEYLRHNNYDYKISAKIVSLENSNGDKSKDEQGHALQATTVAGKGPKDRKFGANVGGLIGMPASTAGDHPESEDLPPIIRVVGEGSESTLAIGSTLGISARSNGIGDLPSLKPNTPEVDPYALPDISPTKPTAAPTPTSAAAQPEMKSTAIGFIPGERTIFFDDFSDVGADGIPPHWPVREGKLELRLKEGAPPEIYAPDNVSLTSPEFVVPANFTFESEFAGGGVMEWNFRNGKTIVLTAVVHADRDAKIASAQILAADGSALGSGKISLADTSKPIEFELLAQQRKMGAYLNGQKVIDVDEFQFAAINHFDVVEAKFRDVSIHKVRVAESAPDFTSTINASRKFVTHGIEFDDNSDRLKPESAAVLKEIAAALAKDPQLKLEIDAYTDSSGDDAHNVELSKLRAQAVQAVLVTQFGIAAARLTVNGFGAAKPIGSNGTAEGRAENRRIEFVKK
jgi:OmpA-OmpF porin, OOP family